MVRVLPTRVLVAVAVLSLVACSDGSDEATPSATVGTAAPSTTPSDPYAVPPVIDEDYVNRVLAGLDAAVGEVVRLVVSTKSIPPEAIDRLKAIYANNERVQLELDLFQREMRTNFSDYKPNPGNQITVVREMITLRPTCVFAEVARDYSPVGVAPGPPDTQWVALKPLDRGRDPHSFNPTNWALAYDGFPRDRSRPPDPCIAA